MYNYQFYRHLRRSLIATFGYGCKCREKLTVSKETSVSEEAK